VSWLRVVGLSPQKLGFDVRPSREIRGGQSELGQGFLRVLRFSPVSIISPVLHLIFYYIPLYLTDMEQVSNIMQCIKHLSYHTLITNKN